GMDLRDAPRRRDRFRCAVRGAPRSDREAIVTVMWLGSGRLVDPWDLAPHLACGDIRLEDIAHALARINRWTGHTRETISVGAHTLVCAETARRKSRRLGLLALHHDDGEAFFNDLPWAIKRHPSMRAYRDAEHRAAE